MFLSKKTVIPILREGGYLTYSNGVTRNFYGVQNAKGMPVGRVKANTYDAVTRELGGAQAFIVEKRGIMQNRKRLKETAK